MSSRLLIPLYLIVTLLPLLLAALGAREPRSLRDELASGAGMLAFSILLVEFVLSGRFRAVSGRIGMDATMRIHQLIARTALALALVHPFLYAAPAGPARPWDPTRALTLTGEVEALWSGILAWVLLPVLVGLAMVRGRPTYRYETWRILHGLGALAVAALVLHHTLSAGRYAADPALAGLWIALFAVAAGSLFWVYLVDPLLRARRPWRVRAVEPVALRSWEVTVEPVGHAGLAYRAGQFAWLTVGRGPFSKNEHPFSIASAPSEGPALRFLVKELGDFTDTVGRIAPGSPAYVDGPHGNLTLEGRDEPGVAMIAGGIGVAPLFGILREMRLSDDPRPRVLIYANREQAQIIHREELAREDARAEAEVIHVLSEPPEGWSGETGFVDEAMLRRHFGGPDRAGWLFVLCGPPPMLEAVEGALRRMGVPGRRILSERFDYE